MKEYELTVLIRPDLEADLDAVLGRVKKLVADSGGSVKTEDNWGKFMSRWMLNCRLMHR